MKRTTGIILCLIITSIKVTPIVAQPSITADAKTQVYLKTFNADYRNCLLNKTPEQLQVYYADTIRLMPPSQRTVIGIANAPLYHRAFLNRFTVRDFTRTDMEVLDLGGQVLVTGTFTIQLTLKKTGKEHVLAGKYINLWIKSNVELRLLTEAWNFDQYYGEIQDQLRFDEVPAVQTALKPNVPVNNNISFELAALNKLLDATVTQHDGNTWSLFYSDDAMLMASFYPVCRGRKAVDEYIMAHVKELPLFEGLDIRNDRIDNLGIFVIEYASHIASWRNGGSSGVNHGKNIRIWRREPDHSLKLFRSISMYD